MPKAVGPGFVRGPVLSWGANGGAGALAPDFAANTLATILGDTTGFIAGYEHWVEQLLFVVGNADFAGGGGTLTFELRKGTPTGTALASLTIDLASAIRGHVFKATVSAANRALSRCNDTDKLFLVRTATGTVFTTAEGQWQIVSAVRPQAAK